jgi:hypothetical protein
MVISYNQKSRIVRTDAGDGEKKASNRSGDPFHRTRDCRCFRPDSAYNPFSIARRCLLYAEL